MGPSMTCGDEKTLGSKITMTAEQIEGLVSELRMALQDAEEVFRENKFLKRILKQAVLTHGGKLRIDPLLARAAEEEKRVLECCQGGIRLIEVYYSNDQIITPEE